MHDVAPPPRRQAHTVSPAIGPRDDGSASGLRRWLPWLVAIAVLIAAAVFAGPSVLNKASALMTRAATVEERRPQPPAARKSTGALTITSTPAGAQVTVDGKARGVTPLELADVSPGRHEIALTSDSGSVHRTVTVSAGNTATVDEAIFSGWVAVYSPIEITISEGGRVLRPDDRNQVLLPPGAHQLRFSNKALGYDSAERVEVKPGEGTTVRLNPPSSTLSVTATEAAEVLVDGTRIGDAPLSGVPATLGTHEIVVRRAGGGAERRFTVTVGVAPFTLNVDFSQPQR